MWKCGGSSAGLMEAQCGAFPGMVIAVAAAGNADGNTAVAGNGNGCGSGVGSQ